MAVNVQVPDGFVEGLEGVTAFTTEIAEPDKNGGNLRYRGVDIEDLVENNVTFSDVWALLVDGKFGTEFQPYAALPHAAVVSLNSPPDLARSVVEVAR